METPAQELQEDIDFDTRFSKRRAESMIETYEKFNEDSDKERRIQLQVCPTCHYIRSQLGGSAMTQWNCAICKASQLNGSTNCPKLCFKCAKKYDLCRECGSEMFSVEEVKQELYCRKNC